MRMGPDPDKNGEATGGASTLTLARRLWRDYLRKYGARFLLALLAMGVYAASYSAIPVGVEWINSAFSDSENRFAAAPRDILVWGPPLILVVALLNAGAQYLQARLSLGAGLSALRDIQRDMFSSLMALDFAQIRAEASGQIISRFTNDPMVLRETLTRLVRAVRDALTLAGLCAVMIYYDGVLFAIVLVAYALAAWPIAAIGHYLRRKSKETQDQAGDVASLVNETAAGADVVKSFQLEAYEKKRGAAAFNTRLKLLKNLTYMRAANEPVIFVIGALAIAGVVVAGAWRVGSGALEGPQFVAFMVTLVMLSQPARSLSTLNAIMQEGFAAFERMLTIIDMRPRVVEPTGAKDLVIEKGAITFQDVHFSYANDSAALKGLSLEIPPAETAAIVGESGAGKSTLFALMARFYDVDEGAITIDGQNIADVTIASLRSAIAVVGQDAFLFDDTVRANIAMGRPGADEAEIIAAAKAAAAHEFILDLPGGYDARVGEGGANLSGGQRQRIAIARAFLKDAPILLLDEATSALDAASEGKVQEAISRLTEGRTTMVIAHRLSTVRNAALIVVMSEGRVIETGTHETLMSRDSAYRRLAQFQLERANDAAE